MSTTETGSLEVELMIEELETVVAPGTLLQHNEVLKVELTVEEANRGCSRNSVDLSR